MALTYTNYRWEKPGRKGDRYLYKRDVSWPSNPTRTPEEQIIAIATYEGNSKSPHWGTWRVSFGAQSPELNYLRNTPQDRPEFRSKDDAMAWVTAMVRFSL